MATAQTRQPADSRNQDLRARLASFADLAHYNFTQRLIIRTVSFALYWLIRVIGVTLRFEIIGREYVSDTAPQIFCFWHNRIPVATYFWRQRGIVVMSSRSFDSE